MLLLNVFAPVAQLLVHAVALNAVPWCPLPSVQHHAP